MSILIRGMEMPESGTYEVSIDSANGKDKTVMSLFVRGEGGLICCGVYELVPVPPHGRMIDADALEQEAQKRMLICNKYDNQFQKPYEIMRAIALAPAIVEAEEGET